MMVENKYLMSHTKRTHMDSDWKEFVFYYRKGIQENTGKTSKSFIDKVSAKYEENIKVSLLANKTVVSSISESARHKKAQLRSDGNVDQGFRSWT